MENKKQHRSVIIALIAFSVVAFIVGLIGFFTIGSEEEVIQGQIDVEEYRVSSKVPSRVLRLLVKEGDYVHAGDTLAILDAPEVEAKAQQVRGMEDAATAMSDMARAGARKEQIQGAFELWQQAKAGLDIAKKSYERVQRLFDEGVVSEQKRNGARREEKAAAQAQVNSAKGAVNEVNSYRKETVQVAQMDGEVSTIYPKVGELLGSGSPIMTISIMNDIWGTFNMREDQLNGLKLGDVLKAFVPAFNKEIELKVYSIKDEGSYATWKATKSNGQYDMKTFEVKARPVKKFDGLRPGMSVIIK